METAVSIARGELLAGFSLPDAPSFDEWLFSEREKLHRQILQYLHQLTESYLQNKSYEVALKFAQQQIAQNPLREEAHRNIILLLAILGRKNEAIAHYEKCKTILDEEIGVEPSTETKALLNKIISGEDKYLETPEILETANPPSLPHPIVGRDDDIEKIANHLKSKECRLLSIIGLGGVGKTTLTISAIQNADVQSLFPDGVYFISLGELADADLVGETVAQQIGLTRNTTVDVWIQLKQWTQGKVILIVLDNFEMVIQAGQQLSQWLLDSPHLKLLVTSRESLNIQAENRFILEGLPYPDPKTGFVNLNEHYSATFFVQVARRVKPNFMLTDSNTPAIIEICRLVQGMPLAIEIAASWVRLFDCQDILLELKKNLGFLASTFQDLPKRQQSMEAVFSQSCHLLSMEEQKVLFYLAHFKGGFSQQAIRAIFPENFRSLSLLVDKSLIQVEQPRRFKIHSLLRQFILEQFDFQLTDFKEQYGRYFLNFISSETNKLRDRYAQAIIQEIQNDLENIKQAWHWIIQTPNIVILNNCVQGLGYYFQITGPYSEAIQQFKWAIHQAEKWETTLDNQGLLCQLNLQLSHFYGQSGLFELAIQNAHRAQLLSNGLENQNLLAKAYRLEAEWERSKGNPTQAMRLLIKAKTLYPRHSHSQSSEFAQILNQIGLAYLKQSQYSAALSYFDQALEIFYSLNDWNEISTTLGNLGHCYQQNAAYADALEHLNKGLKIAEETGYKQAQVKHIIGVASVNLEVGELEKAYRLFQKGINLAKPLGYLQGIIRNQVGMATSLIAQGKLDEADRLLCEAKSYALEGELIDLIGLILSKEGIIFAQRGAHTEAIAAYEEAVSYWIQVNNQTELGRTLGNLGTIYLRMGDNELALRFYKRALASVEKSGAKQAIAHILVKIGTVYLNRGDYAESTQYFSNANNYFKKLSHTRGLSLTEGYLGIIFYRQGEFEQARPHYETAIKLCQRLGDELNSAIWNTNLGDIDKELGELDSAMQRHQLAADFFSKRAPSRFLPDVMLKQATIHFEKNEYTECHQLLEKIMELIEQIQDNDMRFESQLLKARLAQGFLKKQEAISSLKDMLQNFSTQNQKAEIYFYLCQLTKEAKDHALAIQLYQELILNKPTYKAQSQLEILLNM
ncbi:MAG: tetratricopeptide repeat protein [Chloroflexota bacterium]